MGTTWLSGRQPNTMLLAAASKPALALILALTVTLSATGCEPRGGDDETEATGQADSGTGIGVATGQTGGSSGDGAERPDGSSESDEVDRPEDIALGEITDPSETEDPEAGTPDTTPQSETHRLRAAVQTPLAEGAWRIADERATSVLERSDLDPEFRLELEAYRDLARAAGTGDDTATGDAIDRLQRIEPRFVDDLADRGVLPATILPRAELEGSLVAAPDVEQPRDAGDSADDRTDEPPTRAGTDLDAVAGALATGDWQLADRLAEDMLAGGTLTSEDAARIRLYEELAEAHTEADATAIARATESLATLDPDLVRRLSSPAPAVDAGEITVRADG